MQQQILNISVGAKNRLCKQKKIHVPEGYTLGHPDKSETGNYLINDQKIVYFWDGNKWHRAVKDLYGELGWHEALKNKMPKVRYFKFLKPITC